MASFLPFLNIEFELQGGLVGLLVLRSNLSVPAVLAVWELVVKDKYDVTGLSLLSNDDLLRAVDNEIASLVIHAFLLPQDSLVVFIREMALGTSNHDRDLAKLDLLLLVFLDNKFVFSISVTLLNVDVDLAVDLVGHVPDPGLMGKVWVPGVQLKVHHHGLAARVDLAKDDPVLDIPLRVVFDVLNVVVLLMDPNSIELVFFHAI